MKLQHRIGLLFVFFGVNMITRSAWPEVIAMGVITLVIGITLFLAEGD